MNSYKALFGIDVEEHTVTIGRFNIHYIKAGTGPNLLLLHGANIGLIQWYPNLAQLAKHFTIYAVDIPGSGRSSKIDFFNIDLKEDLLNPLDQFIKKLIPQKIHIIGHSIGAWLAVKLARQNPGVIDSLVLVDPIGLSKKMPFSQYLLSMKWFAKLLTRTVMKNSPKNLEQFLRDGLHTKQAMRQEFIDSYISSIPSPSSNPLALMHSLSNKLQDKNSELLISDDLKKINQRFLIIVGEFDHLVKIPQELPHTTIQNTGHVPSLESPEKFNGVVLDFLLKS